MIESFDQYGKIILTEGLVSSKEVNVVDLPGKNNTPIFSMNIVYSPKKYAIDRLFGMQQYSKYFLQINLSSCLTPEQRIENLQTMKSAIESLQDNNITIVATNDNYQNNNNPSTLLVMSPDVEVLMQKIEDRSEILGKKASKAVALLHEKQWPEFSKKTARLITA